ncbi:hypothetical protein GCM10010272_70800 [Streptomyces lateritius]|nr:hypothetical protein GCM10010272_70800 [Streptomyces lateritius]
MSPDVPDFWKRYTSKAPHDGTASPATDTIETVSAGLAPRARLAVWPDMSSDTGAVLGTLPTEGLVECVWQDEDGRIHSAVADGDQQDRCDRACSCPP